MSLPIVYCIMQQNRLLETKHCIDVVRPHVDRMVIVDGGSIDDSIFYLRNRKDVDLFLHPWKDNFSEQRTHYLDHAREIMGTDEFWVLVSDPDEWYTEGTAKNLRRVQDFAVERQFNAVAFQCQCVTLEGEERVYENLDQYWKALFFKYRPGMQYIGNPHETLVDGNGRGLSPMRVDLIYEHVKQANVHWHRGLRNMYVGGGGPNLGATNNLWLELREIVYQVYGRALSWHEFDKELIKGNIDHRIKDWLIKVRLEDGWDGSSEHREAYKTYFRIYHPEEEPEELKDEHIP